jgi:phenylalanyl-tRNA synthetase beta chain
MLISFSWLKQYVNLPDSVTPEEVAEKLKLSTVEVEGINKPGALLENVVVGKVIKCEKHPNADKLKVCEVDVGNEKLKIVCGGSNVADGQLVAVAKNGAKVQWHGQGDLVELKPTTIRGVESNGMICASDEIGLVEMFLKKDEKEILDLSSLKLKPGTPLAQALALNDAVLEIDNKSLSNRPDLWGHYGMAREVAALTNREVGTYETKKIAEGKGIKISIKNADTKLCPRYMAVSIAGVTVSESPAWLKERLSAVGLRPINNIVDITNFVMLDLGQPLHAFDAQELTGQSEPKKITITLRHAKDDEPFTTLDGKERKLNSQMLVIEGQEGKPALIPGVMGGLSSGITDKTTTIVFESANFDAALIRKTSTTLGLRTDSSARFEKSLDPNLCPQALAKAVSLTLELCPGAKVVSNIADDKHFHSITTPLEIPIEFFAKKLGVEIPTKTIVTTLTRLGFGVTEKKKSLSVKIPSWRATKDISIPEDIVEEVLRVYGYHNVPSTLPNFVSTPPEKNTLRALENAVRDVLVRELGYTESYNYSFVSSSQIAKLGDDPKKYLELDNPVSKEKPFIRRNLLPNLLENVQNNAGREQITIFEVGTVFHGEKPGLRAMSNGDELLPQQDTWLSTIATAKKDQTPFWAARRVAESLERALGIKFEFKPASAKKLHPWQHPTRTTWLFVGSECVGRVYELHPATASAHGIEWRVGLCSINLSLLTTLLQTNNATHYRPLSLYPEVLRDIAFVVKKDVTHEELLKALSKADQLVTGVQLFDVYSGSKLVADHKSVAYRITLASPERTLTSAEVDAAMGKLSNLLKTKFSAEVR